MPSVEYDLRYLQAGLANLEEYLLGKHLYWEIGISAPRGETPYPALTPGSLLLAQARLHKRTLTGSEEAQYNQLTMEFETRRRRWRSAWERKAWRDFQVRLKIWGDFLEEYRARPQANVDRYSYEVTRRVQLELLKNQDLIIPEPELEAMQGLDAILRHYWLPGAFIWEAALAECFPKPVYWYLHGKLNNQGRISKLI